MLFDPKIERTAKANRKQAKKTRQQKKDQQKQTSTSSSNTHIVEVMAEEQPPPPPRRTLGDFGRRNNRQRLAINYQLVEANAFEIKFSLLNELKQNQFSGADSEDPNQHLVNFFETCGTLTLDGVSEEARG